MKQFISVANVNTPRVPRCIRQFPDARSPLPHRLQPCFDPATRDNAPGFTRAAKYSNPHAARDSLRRYCSTSVLRMSIETQKTHAYVLTHTQRHTSASLLQQCNTAYTLKLQAAALLLSLGIATGSVSDVVGVVKLLLERDAPALPPSAEPFVERLRTHSPPRKVGCAIVLCRRLQRCLSTFVWEAYEAAHAVVGGWCCTHLPMLVRV